MLVDALPSLESVEAYLDDKYLPSFLVKGESKGTVFHAQIATDLEAASVRIVTMYVSDPDEWEHEFKMRKAGK
jgi:hypothetical protein